eukprot:TRINITY_DN1694_c0_g2_i7.p2 TRINITY_DN1694_c0_g2~~TRINITY_DN1694_c0_g2_i7.p2  ORF type:complete len:128 (-),score=36.35 TRINITY_DN1694_c0_g2_i7:695-1078(-)
MLQEAKSKESVFSVNGLAHNDTHSAQNSGFVTHTIESMGNFSNVKKIIEPEKSLDIKKVAANLPQWTPASLNTTEERKVEEIKNEVHFDTKASESKKFPEAQKNYCSECKVFQVNFRAEIAFESETL